LDFVFSIILAEELVRVGVGMLGLSLHRDIVTPYIANYGTEEKKEKNEYPLYSE
jgi:acyl-CoA dehydrogenase